jgi:hypothetical protein
MTKGGRLTIPRKFLMTKAAEGARENAVARGA